MTVLATVLGILNITQSFGVLKLGLGRTLNWYSHFPPAGVMKSVVIFNQMGAFSSFLLLTLPLMILSLRYPVGEKMFLWRYPLTVTVSILAVLGGIFLTGSRSSWIAAVAVLIGLFVLTNIGLRRHLVIVLLVTVTVIVALSNLPEIQSAFEDFIDLKSVTYHNRMLTQRIAWNKFRDQGYVGVDYAELHSIKGRWLHNAYLVFLFGAGTLSALPVFFFILVSLLRSIWFVLRTRKKSTKNLLIIALLAGVLGPLVEWLAYGNFFNPTAWLGLSLLWHTTTRAGRTR
jgi:hypothetical protein